MFYLLVTLSLLSMGIGALVVGFGVPIRETTFGTGLLVAGSVVITGGFVLVGLAAAVAELQLAVKALRARVPGVPRPLRPVERKEAEKRPGPPRLPIAARAAANGQTPPAPQPPSPSQLIAEAPPFSPPQGEREEPVRKRPGPEWLRRAMSEIEHTPAPAPELADTGSEAWPRPADMPERGAPMHPAPTEPDLRPAAAAPLPPVTNRFDAIWPSERRRFADPAPEERIDPEPAPRATESRPPFTLPLVPPPAPMPPSPSFPPPPSTSPPPPPLSESAPSRNAQRDVAILKSGVIDEMAYTLFTDGSIEAQMPDGTMRFASIEELRHHLDQHGD